eukprot:1820772-Amphidinium_carterae.1
MFECHNESCVTGKYVQLLDPRCRFPKLDDASLRTSDIDGARPFLRHRRLYPDGPAVKDGVPGSFSKRHYPEVCALARRTSRPRLEPKGKNSI